MTKRELKMKHSIGQSLMTDAFKSESAMTPTQLSRKRRGRRGQSSVEFAMCATAFCMVLFGLVYYGKAIYTWNLVSYAAREATRAASVHGSSSSSPWASSNVTTFVTTYLNGLSSSPLTVTTTWSPNNNPGSTVTVKVSYNFPIWIPFMSASTLNMSSSSQTTMLQ